MVEKSLCGKWKSGSVFVWLTVHTVVDVGLLATLMANLKQTTVFLFILQRSCLLIDRKVFSLSVSSAACFTVGPFCVFVAQWCADHQV